MRVCVFNSCYFPVIFYCAMCILLHSAALQMGATGATIIHIILLYASISDEYARIYYRRNTVLGLARCDLCGVANGALMDPIYETRYPAGFVVPRVRYRSSRLAHK